MTGWSSEALRRALRLYLLADTGLADPERLPDAVALAISGGVTCVQLRTKSLTTLAHIDLARTLGAICRQRGVPFLVNDRVDVALAAGADGVHVGHIGEEDMLPRDARRLMGPGAIVGVSVGSAEEAADAAAQAASYVSAGPMFETATKPNAGPAAGASLLRAVRAATELPLVAIGGITPDRASVLFVAGADGVCVGAAIVRADSPEQAARAFASTIHQEEAAS